MPELDYALVGEHVRAAEGIAHILGAGVDTIFVPQVPSGHNLALLIRLTFTQEETGRPYEVRIVFRDADGNHLAELTARETPLWREDMPAGWPVGVLAAINLGVPLPAYGLYSFQIVLGGSVLKTIPLRVLAPPTL